ncbi:MAG: hypothetical protein Q8S01_01595 [Ignavibacteria bacterium]|nr:hypothetical protein [Ignavibacteria bacterium]
MEEKINIIEETYNKVLEYLEILSEENFDIIFPKAKIGMEYVNRIKNEIKNQFGNEEFSRFEEKLLGQAKLIKIKYDDIVTVKQLKLATIAEEISYLQNQKKIANYYR